RARQPVRRSDRRVHAAQRQLRHPGGAGAQDRDHHPRDEPAERRHPAARVRRRFEAAGRRRTARRRLAESSEPTIECMMPGPYEIPLPSQLWKTMTESQRLQAAVAFWRDMEIPELQVEAATLLAQCLKARPRFIAGLPIEKMARHLVRM